MNAVNLETPLIPFEKLASTLEHISAIEEGVALNQLVTDLAVLFSTPSDQVSNTIALLESMNLVTLKADLVQPTKLGANSAREISADETLLTRSIVTWLENQGVISEVSVALEYDPSDKSLWISKMRVPWRLRNLSTLLLEAGVVHRESVIGNQWRVEDDYSEMFLAGAKLRNRNQLETGKTLAQLKKSIEGREERGRAAEDWVLAYERERLLGHPLSDQIQIVSDDNVSAGFDIISFSTLGALEHDRYIEVKSFSGREKFFWSKDEIKVARSRGENYYLYLVDLSRILEKGYEPHMICGPYSYFFESDHPSWSQSVQSYEFTRTNEAET